jgi:hypothetical protein
MSVFMEFDENNVGRQFWCQCLMRIRAPFNIVGQFTFYFQNIIIG